MPSGLRAFGDLGLSMFWSLGQKGLTKGPFEALGDMAYMGFSTFGVLCTFTMSYYSINRDTRVPAPNHSFALVVPVKPKSTKCFCL